MAISRDTYGALLYIDALSFVEMMENSHYQQQHLLRAGIESCPGCLYSKGQIVSVCVLPNMHLIHLAVGVASV